MNDTLNTLGILDTEIIGAEEQDQIVVTASALHKVRGIRQENNVPEEYSLRLGTRSGGCSGMNYIIGFDSEISEFDKVFTVDTMNVVVDRKSLFYLMGITLDYIDDEYGSGFVFNNPNNAHTCGCGGGGH
jgi:iron-sulfur cluster assembly protein